MEQSTRALTTTYRQALPAYLFQLRPPMLSAMNACMLAPIHAPMHVTPGATRTHAGVVKVHLLKAAA